MKVFRNVQQLCKSTGLVADRSSVFYVATWPSGGDKPNSSERTFFPSSESTPKGSSHADFPILHIVHCQVPDWDGLSVHLKAAPGIPGHWSCQDQELREEEHVKPLWRHMTSRRWKLILQWNSSWWQKLLSEDINSHQAALVPQLAMTEQGLTVVYEGISLLVIQIFKLVYVILAFRLPFSDVDIRQNFLDYNNLGK